jgi:hypothetical protein
VVTLREGRGGLSGHTLKGSPSPGEAETGHLAITGGSDGTETLKGPPSGKAGEGSLNQKSDTSVVLNL